MAERLSDRDIELIYEAMRFFVWGAGEGLSPLAADQATEPEQALFEYACATGDEDYDGYPDRFRTLLTKQAKTDGEVG